MEQESLCRSVEEKIDHNYKILDHQQIECMVKILTDKLESWIECSHDVGGAKLYSTKWNYTVIQTYPRNSST